MRSEIHRFRIVPLIWSGLWLTAFKIQISRKSICKMSIKILQLDLVLVSTFEEFVADFTLQNSAIGKITVTNKTRVKTNILTASFCSDYKNKNDIPLLIGTKLFDLNMPIRFSDFVTYIILTRNLTHYPKYQIYTLI